MPENFETSGSLDLLEAFKPPEAPAAETPVAETPAAETPAAQTPADFDRLIGDERVQRQISAQVQSEIDRRQQAAYQAQNAAYLRSLPDQDYGRLVRQQDQASAAYQQTAEQVASHLYNQWWGDLSAFLEKEGIAADDRPDPMKFQSFEDLQAAVAEKISDRRAEKKAEVLAKTKAEAIVKEKLAEVYREYGDTARQPIIQSAGAAEDMPETASGIDFLRAHYREKDRSRG